MRFDRLFLLLGLAGVACRTSSPYAAPPGSKGPKDAGGATQHDGGEVSAETGGVDPEKPATLVAGAWNLNKFSEFGSKDQRIGAIAAKIDSLGVDVLGVEDVRAASGTLGEPPQAWDVLLESLPGWSGVLNPWSDAHSSVGLLWRDDTTAVVSSEALFEGDPAFARPALLANIEVTRGGGVTKLGVIVVHLPPFQEHLDTRRAACKVLDGYVRAQPVKRFLVIGDFSDDPYDAPAENVFADTFLAGGGEYVFLTASLSPETVTSTDLFHYVKGKKVTGEFLDHAIVTTDLHDDFTEVTSEVAAVPESEFPAWKGQYSNHFPILVRFD